MSTTELTRRADPAVAAETPDGPVDNAAAWYGDDMAAASDWIYALSAAEIDEIDAALRHAQDAGKDIIEITASTFPLPRLAPRLTKLRDDVMNGRGFAVIRGLPAERYSMAETAAIYYGIGTHLGSARSQNAEGHVLGHVCDLGHDPYSNDFHRGYRAPGPLAFHTDSVDMVGLMCLQPAMRGGESRIVSSVTMHNEIWKRRPDLAPRMYDPIYRDRRGEIPEGKEPWWVMPIFQWYEERLFSHFSVTYIRSAERFESAPRLTADHLALIDLIAEVASEPSIHLQMPLRVGDIQFLNNHLIFHGRAPYEDWPDGSRKRYFLRLWICPPNGPPLPPAYADRYGKIEIGDRGGIVVPGARLKAPLEPN